MPEMPNKARKYGLVPGYSPAALLRTAIVPAFLLCGGSNLWGSRLSDPDAASTRPVPALKLVYLNPERNHARPEIGSLDDAIRMFKANAATDGYMRDSLGISQSTFEIYAGNDEACDSLRGRVFGILQAIDLRFQAGDLERMRLGPARGSWLNPRQIPVASAYFALRDSLMNLRGAAVMVQVEETPYRSPFTLSADSALAFLERLRDLSRGESGFFRKKLFESVRMPGMDYEFPLGVDCSIAIGRLLSKAEEREKPQSRPRLIPGLLRPSRDQPILVRLESLDNIARSALALAAAGFLTGASLWIGIAWRFLRKRRS